MMNFKFWQRDKTPAAQIIEYRDVEGVPISASDFLERLGIGVQDGRKVTIEQALTLPVVFSAVNFLAGTMAALPLHVFKKDGDNVVKQTGPIADLFNHAVNDGLTSFNWRKYSFVQTFTGGRQISFIERDPNSKLPINIFSLDPKLVKIKRKAGKVTYHYKERGQAVKKYDAADIIDIMFMPKSDGISHYSPIQKCNKTIGRAISALEYSTKLYDNGGVPAFVMTGPIQTSGGLKRASDDLEKSVKSATKDKRLALTLPDGHKIEPLGADPSKMQMSETEKSTVIEVARLYNLPPVFLQDFTTGTFNNSEHQDLHLVKHTISHWVAQAEEEINLKCFGRNSDMYVEFNIDGLLRGDIKTRYEAYKSGIHGAFLTPNEVRVREGLPKNDTENADKLLVQGATVPLDSPIKEIKNVKNES